MSSSKLTLSLLQLVLVVQLSSLVKCQEESFIHCIELESDFERYNWNSDRYDYAETSEDLPSELKGKLSGDGIFYFVGDSTANKAFFKTLTNLKTPSHLYLKYYGHVSNPDVSQMYVSQGESATTTLLDATQNFVWSDRIVPLDADKENNDVDFGASNFLDGEFFLIDRFVVVSGSNMTVEEIEEHCWSTTSSPTTTTTSTEATEKPSSSTIDGGDVTTTSAVTRMTTEKPSSDGLSTFKILLYIVLPGVVLLAIILLIMYYCRRHRDSRKSSRQHLVI